jgi:hypothetical protein
MSKNDYAIPSPTARVAVTLSAQPQPNSSQSTTM